MFISRDQAGQLLAGMVVAELQNLQSPQQYSETIVTGLTRGGVIVAAEVAATLNARMNFLAVAKIENPFEHDVVFAAVSSTGVFVLNDTLEFCRNDFAEYIQSERMKLQEECKILEQQLMKAAELKNLPELRGARVLIVDEGAASGMTALAAVRTTKEQGAKQVILAVPVISQTTKERLKKECDLVVSLTCPHGFAQIAQFYESFGSVSDAEIAASIHAASNLHTLGASPTQQAPAGAKHQKKIGIISN